MDLFALPPLAGILNAAYTALLWVADTIEPIAGTGSAAAAIALVTLLVRAALVPAGIAQAKAEQTRLRLAPLLRELQRRHRKDPERLRRETMRLYADENASPFGGCIPMLAQAPIVGVLYAVFLHPSIGGQANQLLTAELAGVPLGTGFVASLTGGTLDAATGGLFTAIALVTVAVAEATRRSSPPVGAPVTDHPGTAAVARMLPAAAGAGVLLVPLAAAVYLVITVGCTLVQRLVLRRTHPVGGDA